MKTTVKSIEVLFGIRLNDMQNACNHGECEVKWGYRPTIHQSKSKQLFIH